MNKIYKILVVDDVEVNRDIICRHLENFDYDLKQVESGDDALRAIEQEAFDLVLLDIMMPGIDGIEVLTRLRKRFSLSELPIIMVTAKSSPEDITQALDLGANDYLTKPISKSVLKARVNTHLKAADSQKSLQLKVDELFVAHQKLQKETLARKRMEEKAQYNSFHDRLTGLGNWNYLQERMDGQIRLASFSKKHTIAIAVAIRNLRTINETLNFSSGDAVLTELAELLRSVSGDDVFVARIGAGKFLSRLAEALRNRKRRFKVNNWCGSFTSRPKIFQIAGPAIWSSVWRFLRKTAQMPTFCVVPLKWH